MFKGNPSSSSNGTRVNISRVMLLLKMAVRGQVDADLQVGRLPSSSCLLPMRAVVASCQLPVWLRGMEAPSESHVAG